MKTYKAYKIPKESAEKWLLELRSGKYSQHTGELKDYSKKDCYCAIGLYCLANGYEISKGGMQVIKDGQSVDYYNGGIGLDYRLVKSIVDLNDSSKRPFSEIADWIETNVEFI